MTQYMVRQCENTDCGMRIPDDLDHTLFSYCPHCGAKMVVSDRYPNSDKDSQKPSFQNPQKIFLVLDNIRSAYNVGSILRSAEGFGVENIFLCGICPTPQNLKTKKTSLGSENSVSWEYSRNAILIISQMKIMGYFVFGLESGIGGKPIHEASLSLNKPIVLVCGNEVSGIDPGVLSLCDEIIEIPMQGIKRSFNVTIAVGIALFFFRYSL